MERDIALLADERASFLPPVGHRDEIGGRCQLDVEIQLLLEPWNLAQQLVLIGNQLDVDVDGGCSPAMENRSCAAGEINPALVRGDSAKRTHELLDAG